MNYPVLSDRLSVIGPLVEGKTVLDLGCVDHEIGQVQGSWLHRELVRRAAEVVGVDHLPEAVEALGAMGYDVVCQNAEELELNRVFNVVVAGEIIEHLCNPGRMLDGVRRHLTDQGLLILTTPNPFSAAEFFKILKRNRIKVNPDHTAWYDPVTIQVLLAKCGFTAREIYWLNDFNRFPMRSLFARLRSYFHDGFLVVAERKQVL